MTQDSRAQFRSLKIRFDAVHAAGMASLASGDYQALSDAVNREREILDEQHELIVREQQQRDADARSRRLKKH